MKTKIAIKQPKDDTPDTLFFYLVEEDGDTYLMAETDDEDGLPWYVAKITRKGLELCGGLPIDFRRFIAIDVNEQITVLDSDNRVMVPKK